MEPRQRRSKVEKVRIDSLRVPAAGKAQRPFHQAKGDRIAAEFDIDSFGFPAVCRVDGVNWLVDGQHRVYGIRKSGYAKSTDEIECEVYEGLPQDEMARMFLRRNQTTPVTAFERFGVAVTAGYSAEVAISEIVAGLGLQIGHPKTTGNIFSVGALRRVYDRDGADVLGRVLRVLRDAYASSPQGFGRRLIEGVALVFATYSRIDDAVLVRALAGEPHGLHGLQRRAEDYRERLGRQVPECVAAGVVDIYNEKVGKRNRLVKWWKAHTGGRLRRPARAPSDR